MLLEVVTGAVDDAGITRAEVDFTCAGSCDYVAGQAFSFVQNIDAIGAWPPKRDSHVEMDGAWALYEAWVRLLARRHRCRGGHGLGPIVNGRSGVDLPDGDGPVLPGSTRRRPREPRRAPGPGAARRRGQVTERQMAEIAVRTRRDALGKSARPGQRRLRRRRPSWPPSYVTPPLRRHDLPPITDGACAIVIARADRARQLSEHPVWITGFAHCAELHYPGMRDLCVSHVDPDGGQGGRARRGPGARWPSCRRPSPTRSRCWSEALGLGTRRGGQPVRWAVGRQPHHGDRSGPDRQRRPGDPGARAPPRSSATRRRVRACSRTSSASWRE